MVSVPSNGRLTPVVHKSSLQAPACGRLAQAKLTAQIGYREGCVALPAGPPPGRRNPRAGWLTV